jgi:hypothetical protein
MSIADIENRIQDLREILESFGFDTDDLEPDEISDPGPIGFQIVPNHDWWDPIEIEVLFPSFNNGNAEIGIYSKNAGNKVPLRDIGEGR